MEYRLKSKKDQIKEFKDILPSEIKRKIKKKYIEKKIIDEFNSMLSKTISNHVKAIYIYKNEIYCAVDNPLWGNEIISYKDHYLKKINNRLKVNIKNVRFKLNPSLFKIGNKKEEQVIDLTEEQKKDIDNKLKDIKDNSLKKVMYNFLISKYTKEKKDS